MLVSGIAALDLGRVIGRENALPWRLPSDLRRFREITMGKPVVMGRKTFESIGRPLARRRNIVLSRNPAFRAEGCEVVHSLDEALRAVAGAEECIVIGGAALFKEAMPHIGRLYLTVVEGRFEGDVFFPHLDLSEWSMTREESLPATDVEPWPQRFVVLERITPGTSRKAPPPWLAFLDARGDHRPVDRGTH